MTLLEELKRVEKKKFRTSVIILVILAVVLSGVVTYCGMFKLLKPNDFWNYSERLMDGDDSMKGEFAKLKVDYLMDYYIQESDGKESENTEKQIIRNDHAILAGRFGRINAMVQMTPANRNKAMMEYEEEDILAKKMFKLYE